MNYKNLFQRIVSLLSAPAKAWDGIKEEGITKDIQSEFVYPLIGLCGLSEFIGSLIGRDLSALMFQVALTRCCALAVALFGGFFLSAYILGKLGTRWLKMTDAYRRMCYVAWRPYVRIFGKSHQSGSSPYQGLQRYIR